MNHKDITLLITGDLCPINRIEQLAINKNFEAVFNDFTDVFQGNDLNIADLECPLTEAASARSKTGPHQKAHPDCIGILKYAGIGLAAMANNHIMDYDYHGAIDTIELCNANNINVVGVGRNIKDAAEPFSVNIRNIRLAILNFADNEFLTTSDRSLMCNQLDPVQIFYDITTARKQHDYIIVIVHAGNEFYELPSPRTQKLYRYLIDVGADAVVAHHTHKFSGYEIYKSKPIFYSLGNFIYDWPGNTNTGWEAGYVVRLILSDKIGFEIIPLKQGGKSPGVFHLNAEEMQIFQNEIGRLNLIISDNNQLEAEFRNYCKSVFPMYDAFIEPNFGKYIAAARKRHLFPKFTTKRKRLLLLNLVRCESHRDVLIKMLTNFK